MPAACFLDQYRYLPEQITADPHAKIDAVSLVTGKSYSLLPDPREELPAPGAAAVDAAAER